MSSNPYKDFYEAKTSGDEFAEVRAEEARKRIERIKEIESYNGCKVSLEDPWEGMGG